MCWRKTQFWSHCYQRNRLGYSCERSARRKLHHCRSQRHCPCSISALWSCQTGRRKPKKLWLRWKPVKLPTFNGRLFRNWVRKMHAKPCLLKLMRLWWKRALSAVNLRTHYWRYACTGNYGSSGVSAPENADSQIPAAKQALVQQLSANVFDNLLQYLGRKSIVSKAHNKLITLPNKQKYLSRRGWIPAVSYFSYLLKAVWNHE